MKPGIAGPLLLVGCGKMGGALLAGWLKRKIAGGRGAKVVAIEPSAAAMSAFRRTPGVARLASAGELPGNFKPAAVLLAVKPQMMEAALEALRGRVPARALVLSIAAGKTIAYLARHFGPAAAIVRAMPNTPAAVGRGITVLVANANTTKAHRATAEKLLGAVGAVEWVAHEALIDPVTALSGGGPAYVFLLIEILAEAGRKAGLPAEMAMRLARATVAGSGELARLSPEPAATLRQNVTSPGGTTLEALKILMAPDGLQPLFDRAIAAATRRARELAG